MKISPVKKTNFSTSLNVVRRQHWSEKVLVVESCSAYCLTLPPSLFLLDVWVKSSYFCYHSNSQNRPILLLLTSEIAKVNWFVVISLAPAPHEARRRDCQEGVVNNDDPHSEDQRESGRKVTGFTRYLLCPLPTSHAHEQLLEPRANGKVETAGSASVDALGLMLVEGNNRDISFPWLMIVWFFIPFH